MTDRTPPSEWICVTVAASPETGDAISDFFIEHGSRGVVVDDTDPAEVILTAYFPVEDWENRVRSELDRLLKDLAELFPEHSPRVLEAVRQPNENWAVAWKDNFTSVPIGRSLVVTPPWLEVTDTERHVIVIEPGEAFGTGTHETTRACLVLLEKAVDLLVEQGETFHVLDAGCGSGILAIAAALLGASGVKAIDNDPVAVASARKNLELNRMEHMVRLACHGVEDVRERHDIVVANLDPMTLRRNRATLVDLTLRYLIISGIPLDQWSPLRDLFLEGSVRMVAEVCEAEWAAALFRVN
jgi:ribosomal protein L11 methyltransferase